MGQGLALDGGSLTQWSHATERVALSVEYPGVRVNQVQPRVTYVITNYNYGQFLDQAVRSLLNQTFEDLEVIVVDDRSTDDSATVLDNLARDKRVVVIRHHENQGNRVGDNEGIALARGEYVGTLDADDFALQPHAVARQVSVLDEHPDVGFVYAAYSFVDEDGAAFRLFRPWLNDYVCDGLSEFSRLIQGNYISHSGTLARRSSLRSIGGYDVELPYAGDFDVWLRLCARYGVGYLSEPLYSYRIHRRNMSHAGVSPRVASDELVRALTHGFDDLPSTAPVELRQRRSEALRRALLATSWGDRSHGRTRRSWEGLLDGLARDPGLGRTREFHAALVKLTAQTLLGHQTYERLAAWRKDRATRRGQRMEVAAADPSA